MSHIASVDRDGHVAVLHLHAGENRFNPDSLDAIAAALDAIEADAEVGALVITGEGKFFSNGLDLAWMTGAPAGAPEAVVRRVHALLARVLGFPAVTVAAINGHAFAAGAMLALACDLRVMRADRGFLCLPEVDIGLPFTPAMTALLRARMTPAVATAAMVLGRRFGGEDALAAGLVDAVAPEAEVLSAAVEVAGPAAAKPREVVRVIKQGLHADTLRALEAGALAEGSDGLLAGVASRRDSAG